MVKPLVKPWSSCGISTISYIFRKSYTDHFFIYIPNHFLQQDKKDKKKPGSAKGKKDDKDKAKDKGMKLINAITLA